MLGLTYRFVIIIFIAFGHHCAHFRVIVKERIRMTQTPVVLVIVFRLLALAMVSICVECDLN